MIETTNTQKKNQDQVRFSLILESHLQQIDKSVIMSSIKPKINIEKALRELNMQMSRRFEAEQPLTQISSNLPSSKVLSKKSSKDMTHVAPHPAKRGNKQNNFVLQAQDSKKGPSEDQPIKNHAYLTISKALQEKTQLIGQQKHQIQVLRQCVEDVKHNKEVKVSEETRIKSEELAMLRAREKEYMEGLAEILALKQNFQEIKRKYNHITTERNYLQQERSSLLNQRNSLMAERDTQNHRFNTLLAENEELNLAISNIKLEKEERDVCVKAMERQITALKQKLDESTIKLEGSFGLEKRANQCLSKLSDVQEQYSVCQMKYFRLQQDYDALRQESEQRLASALRQCRAEREQHEQEVGRLTASLKANEQRLRQSQKRIKQMQEENKRRQQSTETKRLAESLKQAEVINNQLHQEGKKWQSYTKELTKQCQQEKEALKNQIAVLSQENSLQKSDIAAFIFKLQSLTSERDKAEQKALQLSNEREHIFAHYAVIVSEKEQQQKRSKNMLARSEDALASLQQEMHIKTSQQSEIMLKIENLERRLTQENQHLNERNINLQQQIDSLREDHEKVREQRNEISSEAIILQQQIKNIRRQVSYYRQKYEQQLSQYNNLSEYSHSLQMQNAGLLKSNTSQIMEISNFKGQIAILHSDISRLIASSTHPEIAALQTDIAALKQQLTQFASESSQLKSECNNWQVQLSSMQSEKVQMQLQLRTVKWQEETLRVKLSQYQRRIQQKDAVIRQVRTQIGHHVEQIRRLNANIASVQRKYSNLKAEHEQQTAQWQTFSLFAKEQQSQLHQSRLSAEYELDNSQTTISILRQQNSELQRIFTDELERRNTIIKELMAEKRSLYGQLVGRIEE